MRKVTRTWTNKRTGKTVTKTYTYDTPAKKRGGKSLLLVGKNGNIYSDRVKELLNNIDDPGIRSQARTIINNSVQDKEKLSIRSLTSKLAETKEEKFLINMGYTREQFEHEYGFSFDTFMDPNNWVIEDDKKVFVYDGVIYDVTQDYTNKVLLRR